MELKGLQDEDFVNYKKPSMFIGTAKCDWKCCTELGMDDSMCQNSTLASTKSIDIPVNEIVHRYINNPITQAIVIGGLEPMLDISDVCALIYILRENDIDDDVVIYTGYYPNEISTQINALKYCAQKNLIIKYGRYIPNQTPHYDEVLGVNLASNNQYAERIC